MDDRFGRRMGERLRERREERGMTPAHIGAFVGIATAWYWDLEDQPGEVDTLTLSQFLRLCVLIDESPLSLLGDAAASGSPAHERGPTDLLLGTDEYGHWRVAEFLRERCGKLAEHEDEIGWEAKIGWEAEALARWLSDDGALGEIPMPALFDLCAFAGLDAVGVLTACWVALGRPPEKDGPL